jgi:hypothetical protein
LRKILDTTIKHAVNQALSRQNELLERERECDDKNRFSHALAELHFGVRTIYITNKAGKKFQHGEAATEHKGCLCMTSGYLCLLMQQHFRDQHITVKAITAELRRNHLLVIDASQRSSKKLNNMRALFIRLDELRTYWDGCFGVSRSEDFSNIDALAASLGLPSK